MYIYLFIYYNFLSDARDTNSLYGLRYIFGLLLPVGLICRRRRYCRVFNRTKEEEKKLCTPLFDVFRRRIHYYSASVHIYVKYELFVCV